MLLENDWRSMTTTSEGYSQSTSMKGERETAEMDRGMLMVLLVLSASHSVRKIH